MSGSRTLWIVAWTNVVLHGLGLAAAATVLRPGSVLVPVADRMAYLATAPAGWTAGWVVWMLSALAMVAYTGLVARAVPRGARLAIVIAAAGMLIDVSCEVFYVSGFVDLARGDVEPFLAAERAFNVAGVAGANGLYSIAVLLLTLGLRRRAGFPPLAVWLGSGSFAFGMLLAVAGVAGSPRWMELLTGPTIGLYMIWTLVVARAVTAAGE